MVSSYFQRSHLCPLLLLACFSCKCNICWTTFTNPTVLSSHSKHTHTTSQPGPFDHHATAQGQAFLKKTDCWGFLYPQYTLQGTVLNFSMLTMFPRSLSVEQAKKKKKKSVSLLFFHQYIWHHLWRMNKRHTVKQIDPDKILLFVPHEHRGIFKQRKPLHDSPWTDVLQLNYTNMFTPLAADCVGI